MFKLRSAARNAFVLLFLIAIFANYASAAPFKLTNGPIPFNDLSSIPQYGVYFSNLQFNSLTGELTLGSPGSVVGSLVFNGSYSLTLDTLSPILFNQVGATTFAQRPDPITFSFGTFGETIEVTTSTIELTGGVPTKWIIPAATVDELGCFPQRCGGATWTFIDGRGDLEALNLKDMELTSVPEPSSLYLMALGLGVVARFIRKTR